MTNKVTKEEASKAAQQLGSILGKRNSKAHMKRISQNYWSSPAGMARRSTLKKSKLSENK